MASIHTEVIINARPEQVWAVFRDVGAVHLRLLPHRVADTRVEGDVRILTFPGGRTIRELIVDVDDTTRRLAYAVVEGARPALSHHHASFQVFPEGSDRSRLVWITDLLPDEFAPEVRIRLERGAQDMKQTLEA